MVNVPRPYGSCYKSSILQNGGKHSKYANGSGAPGTGCPRCFHQNSPLRPQRSTQKRQRGGRNPAGARGVSDSIVSSRHNRKEHKWTQTLQQYIQYQHIFKPDKVPALRRCTDSSPTPNQQVIWNWYLLGNGKLVFCNDCHWVYQPQIKTGLMTWNRCSTPNRLNVFFFFLLTASFCVLIYFFVLRAFCLFALFFFFLFLR